MSMTNRNEPGGADRDELLDERPDEPVTEVPPSPAETIYVEPGVEAATVEPAEGESREEIRADIDVAREEVAGTLDEIGERLDPGRVAAEAKERVRGATIGRVEGAVETAGETARGIGDMVMETIKRNPIPAAMAGIGLAMLWTNRADGQQRQTPRQTYEYYSGGQGGDGGRGVGDRARQTAQEVTAEAERTAGQVAEDAQRTVGQVSEGAQQLADEAVHRGQRTAQQLGTSFQQATQSNPLGVTVAALGAGAALGLLLPETRPEREMMGEPSRQVGRAIQEGASQALDQVEEAADKAEEKVKQSSQ